MARDISGITNEQRHKMDEYYRNLDRATKDKAYWDDLSDSYVQYLILKDTLEVISWVESNPRQTVHATKDGRAYASLEAAKKAVEDYCGVRVEE